MNNKIYNIITKKYSNFTKPNNNNIELGTYYNLTKYNIKYNNLRFHN